MAEHSWQSPMMALMMEDEFPDVDMNKVIRMCLIHDLGEAFTGDIPTFEKTKEHEDIETNVLEQWVNSFPEPYRTNYLNLYQEMDALQTKEAKLYKALDKLETLIQHNQADLSTWLSLEYELQYTYGVDQMKFSDYLIKLRKVVDEQTTNKINSKDTVIES